MGTADRGLSLSKLKGKGKWLLSKVIGFFIFKKSKKVVLKDFFRLLFEKYVNIFDI